MADDITIINKLENGRAEKAYKFAEDGKDVPRGYKYKNTDYRSHVKKIPSLIKTNGLGQTLAFYNSKKQKDSKKEKNAYDLIYKQIYDWLTDEQCLMKEIIEKAKGKDLTEKVISIDSPQYRAITIEVLAFVNWLRRLADGLIEGEDEGNE
jgi:CRISPR-associated protein Cmr5